jgi:hypothetical protein
MCSHTMQHNQEQPPLNHFTTNAEQYRNKQQNSKRGARSNHASAVKRTVKYLAVCNNPHTCRAVLKASPNSVVKAIANAAYNIERGDVCLTPAQQDFFRTHRKSIAALTSRKIPIERKRKLLLHSQTGGLPFLPILIGTALGALGGKLFGGG